MNAIIYYADQIFAAAGFAPSMQTTATTWAVGGVNVVATFIAIAFIDRLGRRKLLLAGLLGMGLSLAIVGASFEFERLSSFRPCPHGWPALSFT